VDKVPDKFGCGSPALKLRASAVSRSSITNLQFAIFNLQFLISLLALACLTGCTSITTSSNSSIDQLHLLVTSVALDLDGKPGPDGVGVRVYASHTGSSEAMPVKTGTLEILMFDGAHVREQLASLQPRHVWTYPADQLKSYLQKTSIGTSYRFAALWGQDNPTSDRVTLIARYTGPDSTQIYSAPSSIPVAK
jgi:hypothetical protein